ncbi:hypothetical protein BCY76_006710 [Nesterenkonia sp. PF2B19]|nr:hypothetical protein BCY76_006710 [Nesterenkonia sp. PF2B19]
MPGGESGAVDQSGSARRLGRADGVLRVGVLLVGGVRVGVSRCSGDLVLRVDAVVDHGDLLRGDPVGDAQLAGPVAVDQQTVAQRVEGQTQPTFQPGFGTLPAVPPQQHRPPGELAGEHRGPGRERIDPSRQDVDVVAAGEHVPHLAAFPPQLAPGEEA